MKIEHHRDVKADVDTMWTLIRDVERWPDITPTINLIEPLDGGPPGVGKRYRIHQPGQRSRIWTVRQMEEPEVFMWDTTIGPLAMSGRHHIEETESGCRTTLTIELTGFGSRLVGLLAGPVLRKGLAAENDGFKRAAEAAGAG